MKILPTVVPLDNNINFEQYADNTFEEIANGEVAYELLLKRFDGVKREFIKYAVQGYNFKEIADIMEIKQHRIYKIKASIEKDLAKIYDVKQFAKFHAENEDLLRDLVINNKELCKKLSLAEFMQIYLYDYDPEAEAKNWVVGHLQDRMGDIWENNAKSCTLAPREHLKTASILAYVVKKVYERDYPLEINYYHLNKDVASEKFLKLQRLIEKSPMLYYSFNVENAKSWASDKIELYDGTIIQPISYEQGVVGKHPHMIILDDVIDRKVIYSDERNRKAIDKFYMDIYPQISKAEADKKILIIGTAQREDDLYHSLPTDFIFNKWGAIDSITGELLLPEKYTRADLEKIHSDITDKFGEKYWLKEYMNVPFDSRGLIVEAEDVLEYDVAPSNLDIFQGWDLSVGKDIEAGDWTVGVTIGTYKSNDKLLVYVLDIFRGKVNFKQRLDAIREMAHKWNPLSIGIEEVAFQYDTVQTLKDNTLLPIQGVKAIRNKVESFVTELAPYFENHQVYIKNEMKDLRKELLSLPNGEHDDQADALKIAIKMAQQVEPEPNIWIID